MISQMKKPSPLVIGCILYFASFSASCMQRHTTANYKYADRSNVCPDSVATCICTQTGHSWSIDCSDRNLTFVPKDLPENTTTLNLRRNQITELRDDDLSLYKQLTFLYLSFNQIWKLESRSLQAVINLKELHLDSNLLRTSKQSLPTEVFNNLKYLSVLVLHNNAWNGSEMCDYRSDLFPGLTNLKRLMLDGIPSCRFGSGYSKLINLKTLQIFGRLTVIENDTFENFYGLPVEHLNIKTDCNLTSLQPNSFSHFRNLSTLDLGYNRAIDLDKVSDAWYGLNNTKIKTLILTRIIPPNMQTTNVNKIFYRYLKETRIENFYLDKNNIVITEPGISKHLPYLVHLDMSYNRLSNVGSLIADFANMRHLVHLDASHQIKRYDGGYRRKKRTSATTTEDYFSKKYVQNGMGGGEGAVLPCLRRSNVNLCPVIKKENGSYPLVERGPWCFILPPKLQTFNLSSSLNVDLQYMPQLVVLGGSDMREMIYRSNGIRYASGPIVIGNPNPNTLISADFSDNGLSCIAVDLFRWTVVKGGRMDKMFLSSNNLAAQLAEDATGEVFKYYANLTELHLDKNGVKNLPLDVFSSVSNLLTLNLSGNSLRLIQFNFDHMWQLRLLDISDNLITNVNSDTLTKLNLRIDASNLSVNLRGNPIQCTCDSLEFLRWILDKRVHLIEFNQYACLYGDNANSSVTFDNLASVILPDLSFRCSTKTALQVAGGLLALVIVVVAISIGAYRLRWDIHVCFLRFRTRRKDFVDSEEGRRSYEFDAFVIYDKDDQPWVQDELEANFCPNLFDRDGAANNNESIKAFRLCIHGRDFAIGEPIVQNIMSAIERSRKIIVVLSRNFLGSKWCGYELELSNLENVSRGINTIVPILLEEFDETLTKNASPILKHILRNRTYLQWPTRQGGRVAFWKQLRSVLRPSVNKITDTSPLL